MFLHHFKYLGSSVEETVGTTTEISQRMSAAWRNWKRYSGVLCDRRMPVKLKGKVYKTVVRPAVLYGAETWATTRGQEARLEVNEMRMLRWMCGVTRRDKIRNEHIRGTARVVQASKKITEKRLVPPCEENERGAHSEKNARCGNTRETKNRATKPKMERRMQERHDSAGSERGQDNKQGSMEEYDHQLYRRPQMTGKAREEEEEEVMFLLHY